MTLKGGWVVDGSWGLGGRLSGSSIGTKEKIYIPTGGGRPPNPHPHLDPPDMVKGRRFTVWIRCIAFNRDDYFFGFWNSNRGISCSPIQMGSFIEKRNSCTPFFILVRFKPIGLVSHRIQLEYIISPCRPPRTLTSKF